MASQNETPPEGSLEQTSECGPDQFTTQISLQQLLDQSERSDGFKPQAHLMILTDPDQTTTSGVRLSMTELAYECLLQYFSPHRDAPSVTWIDRQHFIKCLMVTVLEDHQGCVSHYIRSMLKTKEILFNTTAILFLSPDAKTFVEVHEKSFLDNLSVILRTTVDKILVTDISQRPSSLL